MCTNLHYIYNKYIHKRILVPCGKCEACRQQKANNRAFRIEHSTPEGYVQLFVTLTYNNDSLPVVRKSELKEFGDVNVYRVNQNSKFHKVIGSCYISELPYSFDSSLVKSPTHYFSNDYIGVIFYKDVQNFFKRLRVNLQRKYNFYEPFKYYSSTEYGEDFFRPHIHMAISVPSHAVEVFRACIVASWPYADNNRTQRGIEVARHCGSYVASYVNSDTYLPKILQIPAFRQKHSYSMHYGMDFNDFSLVSLLEKVERGTLVFNRKNPKSVNGFDSVCIPEYVVNRFFPKFKGYCQVAPSEVSFLLLRPARLKTYFDRKFDEGAKIEYNYYSDKDLHLNSVRLRNAAKRAVKLMHQAGQSYSVFDWCLDYERVWRCYHSTQLKLWYQSQIDDIYNEPAYYYDNIIDVTNGLVRCDYLHKLTQQPLQHENYNANKLRVDTSQNLTDLYRRKVKQKKVTQGILNHYYNGVY